MPKSYERWTVMPHGKLVPMGERILSVVGQISMPLANLPRRMVVVRLRDGRLVIFSAIALDDTEMARLEAFGRPAFLVVPSDKHRLDAHAWKGRYPSIEVVTPRGAGNKVADVVAVDATSPDFGDDAVRFVTVAGTDEHESALIVRADEGTTLVVNDVVGNIRDAKGIGGWVLGLAGFAGDEPRIPRVVKKLLIRDPKALQAQLREWSKLERLERILMSHGDPIERDAKAVLEKLAQQLD